MILVSVLDNRQLEQYLVYLCHLHIHDVILSQMTYCLNMQ